MTMEHKPKDSTPKKKTDSDKPESNQETKQFNLNWVTWEEFQGISGHGQCMFFSTRPRTRPNPKEKKDTEK